ncbi:hypothetical protein WJX73_002489 [Symbiochloris irregularis]|uniref:Protein kinase domain-containing protein n=1 Tax=Symbiochloris irregularis TaxID=706552 RepID=A0AAW1PS67_9CHLO
MGGSGQEGIMGGYSTSPSTVYQAAVAQRDRYMPMDTRWVQAFFSDIVDDQFKLRAPSVVEEDNALILDFLRTFAAALGKSVDYTVKDEASFEAGAGTVLQTCHKGFLPGLPSKPRCAVFRPGWERRALYLVMLLDVQRGDIGDGHKGRMCEWLNAALTEQVLRDQIWGVLISPEQTVVMLMAREGQHFVLKETPVIRTRDGGMELTARMLKAPSYDLGYIDIFLDLPAASGSWQVHHMLGAGRDSGVFAVTTDQHPGHTFVAKVFHGRYDRRSVVRELRCLEALSSSQHPGKQHLPHLHTHTPKNALAGRTLFTIITWPVVRPVQSGQLTRGILQGYLDGLACLHDQGRLHGDVQPRHMCLDEHLNATIIVLGEARRFGCSYWGIVGAVEYADDSVLQGLMEGQPPPSILGEKAFDLVALVKCFVAIRYELSARLQLVAEKAKEENRLHKALLHFWQSIAADQDKPALLYQAAIDAARRGSHEALENTGASASLEPVEQPGSCLSVFFKVEKVQIPGCLVDANPHPAQVLQSV